MTQRTLKLRRLATQEDAVSTIIGVVLLIAITVVLAALLGSSFLGLVLGDDDVQPASSFEFDHQTPTGEPNTLTIRLAEGNSVEVTQLYLRGTIDGETYNLAWTSDELFYEFDSPGSPEYAVSGFGGFGASSEQLKSGQEIELEAVNSDLNSYDLDIIWDNGDKSATLDSDDNSA